MSTTTYNPTIGAKTARSKYKRLVPRTPFAPLNPRDLVVEIVIPVYNEMHSLPKCIEQLDSYLQQYLPYKFQIIIANNGSIDDTLMIAKALAGQYDSVEVFNVSQKGRGRALKAVWEQSLADILSYMDVDLSTGLESFVPMIEPLIAGTAPVATGSRLQKTAQVKRSFKREFISRAYNFIVRRAVKTSFSDAQCGFKAIRRDAATKILPDVKDLEWFFDTELLTKAERKGWKVHEVAVTWDEDADSRVNIIQTAVQDLKGLSRVRQELGATALWEKPLLFGLLGGTSLLYLLNLTINGYANSYYAAAVQAASTSWKAWFFGSIDSANFVTVDKPPVATWIMALSARIFGFSSFSMLLPSALAGIATVWLVYASVKRLFGVNSAFIAGFTMALTPVAALMFRFNNPDSFLTLFLTASGYAFIRALDNKRPLLWLCLTGLLTGCAFNTKMLQGMILLPIMALVYALLAQPKLKTRLWHLSVAGLVTAISTLWWAVAVWLTPAASRPFIGSSTKNSIWDLIMGYNGFGRLLGSGSGMGGSGGGPAGGGAMMGGGGGGGMGPGGTGFGGNTGLLRIFNSDFGPNIAWLIPLALISAGLSIWLLRRAPRDSKQRAAIILWTGWVLLHIAIFSITSGVIHPYYPVVMAPAIAALVGVGAPYIWKAYSRSTTVAWLLPLSIGSSAMMSGIILGRHNNWPFLTIAVLAAGTIASAVFLINIRSLSITVRNVAAGLAVFAVASAPVAFSFSTVAAAHSGSIPTSGPSATALDQTNNESATADSNLVSYLNANRNGATWLVAVASANESSPIQISSGQPVMAVGGFNGGDKTLTLDEFKALVQAGKVQYYAVSTGGRGGMGGGPMGGNNDIQSWVTSTGTVVNFGGTGTTLYKLNAA